MGTILDVECTRCGRSSRAGELACGLCGNLLRRANGSSGATSPNAVREVTRAAGPTGTVPIAALEPSIARTTDGAQRERREPWLHLAVGLATAPVFGLTPILGFMGWFLASLVHEMGHAAFAWFCGMPAIPAISLAGHAAAVHSEQQPLLVAVIAAGLASAAWRLLEGRARWIALALVAVLYPSIALTGAKELLHLLAGHAGELVFATICLWKTLDGGFTQSRFERALYGTVGWYLLGKNVFLCIGLSSDASARATYADNGSFGLTNDFLRAADDVLGWRLESVALLMLAACVLVLPAALALWRISSRRRAADLSG